MKHVKDSTPEEAAATLDALKRSQSSSDPLSGTEGQKMAKDMSDQERLEWLRDHKKRVGG
jgi:hypothetical protein